jgi:cysteine-rich repeat protein
MRTLAANNRTSAATRLRYLGCAGIAAALLVAACTDDAIVYPNRNLRAAAGEGSEAGEAGEASGGASSGGAPSGGSGGGAKAGGGGALLGDAGDGEVGGAPVTGPVCGNGKIEPPEQCDDGNAISGDGCSADCQSSCEKCEKNVCPLYPDLSQNPDTAFDGCYKLSGKIVKGPATGYERAEVCRELVDCIRDEGCAQTRGDRFDFRRCWCDQDWTSNKQPTTACTTDPDPSNPTDPTKFIPGKCASLFQDASEGDKLVDVVKALVATNLAEGRANRLLSECDTRICTEECVAATFGAGPIATISSDIVAKPNDAGESPLGDLLADSQRSAANADFALMSPRFFNHGEINVDLLLTPTANRDADAVGKVLWSEALAVGFGYVVQSGVSENDVNLSLSKGTFTGQQIYDALLQQFAPTSGGMLSVSGLKYSYTFDSANPTATVISDVRKAVDDSLLDKTLNYSVVVLSSTASSNTPIPALGQGSDVAQVPGNAAEVLGEYLKRLPQPIAPPELNRITRLN